MLLNLMLTNLKHFAKFSNKKIAKFSGVKIGENNFLPKRKCSETIKILWHSSSCFPKK